MKLGLHSPVEPRDVDFLVKVCVLAETEFTAAWLWDSVDATVAKKPQPKNPLAYLRTCLAKAARPPGEFESLLKTVKLEKTSP